MHHLILAESLQDWLIIITPEAPLALLLIPEGIPALKPLACKLLRPVR